MVWTAYRRVPEPGACPFCLVLATRGAVYRSEVTAGNSLNRYHPHCHCQPEAETNVDARYDTRISPEDANRTVSMWNRPRELGGRRYTYDLRTFRRIDPPPAPKPVAPVAPTTPATNPAAPSAAEHVDDFVRGDPESLADAVGKTNPHYSSGEKQWRNNCTRCVVAAEMRARGYQVVAAGRETGDYSELILREVFDNVYLRRFNAPSGGRMSSIVRDIAEDVDGKIDKSVEARLWIHWRWKGTRSGHIVMGEIRDGKLSVYDPQTGQTHSAKDFAGRVTRVEYVRVDDLPLSDTGALNYVMVGE